MNKEELLINLIVQKLSEVKIGILVKGISGINPSIIAYSISQKSDRHVYIAAVGYDINDEDNINYTLSGSIEKAVYWRSYPNYIGRIIVFIKNDSNKLHSLSEFDNINIRDLTNYLLELQLEKENNEPTQKFWKSLLQNSDYFTFEMLLDFIQTVGSNHSQDTIPSNMWRLNLLRDDDILSTKYKPTDRINKNRMLLTSIAQLSEDSRKKLYRSLSKTNDIDRERLENAYMQLQLLYKYGKQETLRYLDFSTVEELFNASKNRLSNSKNHKKNIETGNDNEINDNNTAIIRPKELNEKVADIVVSGDEEDFEDAKELVEELKKHFDTETNENNDSIPSIGGTFGDRTIQIENHDTDLRKFIGKVCNSLSWGGLIESEEIILKDAISSSSLQIHSFNPTESNSIISFGSQSLFGLIKQFDTKFNELGLVSAELFSPLIDNLLTYREKLVASVDMIMYYPILAFGVDFETKNNLINYIDAWAKLYHAFVINESIMRSLSSESTTHIAKALLSLDIAYIKTPKEWKAILLPLNPIYLWRYYEIFNSLKFGNSPLTDEDSNVLKSVINNLPHTLSFIIVNGVINKHNNENKVLPYSGTIEMLPTFENKTNRYIGDDGCEKVKEILTRWIGFSPYTKNEIRICTVDAPNLLMIIRTIKTFMDENDCNRVVYDIYLTRKQNGNNEISKLDYSGEDYELGEYIHSGKISVSIHNISSPNEVKLSLKSKPVHIAFYFDQASYSLEFGPNDKALYINPLVISYDYIYDDIQKRGSIFPSSETTSGLIGDYHKVMKLVDIISNNMIPRTTYNGNADMSAVVSTIQENCVQWLVVADRNTNNYDPIDAIPIGELQCGKRMLNIWASNKSRIIAQYIGLLRTYNLYPKEQVLINILRKFGHIASSGLISIPKYGADLKTIENKRKGLLGTIFAASWYTRDEENTLVASLDDDRARVWLHDNKFGSERADLIGLKYLEHENTLVIEPIEVKTRDDDNDSSQHQDSSGNSIISGHAIDQLSAIIGMLKEIFFTNDSNTDMFVAARKEVLKYQIVSECFKEKVVYYSKISFSIS